MQTCAGCGAGAEKHPIVGVTFDRGLAVALPVCAECYHEPAHRKVVLKVHFFPAAQASEAVARAGSSNLG